MIKIILASSSPRRKELMKLLNVPFEIITKDVDETYDLKNNIYEESMDVAKRKAKAVYNSISSDVIVIGSDTIVYCDNKIYGKPKNYEEAFRMIKKISGTHHEVISSLCLLVRKDNQEYTELTYDKCNVFVSDMTDEEINEWINNSDVYTKAGGYAIQEGFSKYVEKIEGDYFSIVGLPVHKLYNLLKKYK